jgi:hypothetical protein
LFIFRLRSNGEFLEKVVTCGAHLQEEVEVDVEASTRGILSPVILVSGLLVICVQRPVA